MASINKSFFDANESSTGDCIGETGLELLKETMKTNTTLTKLNLDGSGEESQMRLNQQFHFVFVFISNEPENNTGNRGETAMNGSFNANMPCDTCFFRQSKRNPLMMIHGSLIHASQRNEQWCEKKFIGRIIERTPRDCPVPWSDLETFADAQDITKSFFPLGFLLFSNHKSVKSFVAFHHIVLKTTEIVKMINGKREKMKMEKRRADS